jgi:hypothetical protein
MRDEKNGVTVKLDGENSSLRGCKDHCRPGSLFTYIAEEFNVAVAPR